MRGGTSKALFFHDKDLPEDLEKRDKLILSAFGSPDIRQIDGMGGANTSTSKVAIIKKSDRIGIDVDYEFGQVSVDMYKIGKTMNCGNISSAVGPFAIDEGLVKAEEPITTVRIYNTNTKKIIVAKVPVQDSRAMTEGDYEIDGVPGTGAEIKLEFHNPQGSVSDRVLPTGNPKDTIEIGGKIYEYSLVDAANPVVFVRAEQFGLTGTELPWEFEARPDFKAICKLLEIIRGTCAIKIGLAKDLEDAALNSQTLPKIAYCTNPKAYIAGNNRMIEIESMDYVGRLFSLGMKMIHAYMGTGAICTIVAANIPGTVVNEIISTNETNKKITRISRLRIGHPFGIMTVDAEFENEVDNQKVVSCGILGRTARRIMDGYVYVRD
jgi:hypothetical protein